MRLPSTSGRRGFFGLKTIVWSLLFLLLIGVLAAASAEAAGSFSGRVWNDLNNDGLMDEAEPGVPGVTLHLQRQDTGEILTALSDATGAYQFSSLPNDSYQFSVDVPVGMLFARYRREGELRSLLTGDDNSFSRPFIVRATQFWTDMNVGLVDSAIIGGIAYLDMNYNGSYDEGEPPYAGVTMEVIRNVSERSVEKTVTGADGAFYFNFIRTGDYRLRAVLPDDGSTFTVVPEIPGYFSNLFEAREGRRENAIESIDTENSMVYEYYVGVALGGRIAGAVFNDEDYSGALNGSEHKLGGVTVQLIGADGGILSETDTDQNGEYALSGVMPGEYRLRFVRKPGFTITKYRPLEKGGNDAILSAVGDYGETAPFTVAMSETLTGFDAGMVQAAALGGVFFYDENDNGLMDAAEGGFSDGSVRLVSGDGEIDVTQAVNPDGTYAFSGVPPTNYTLYYLLPEHAELARVVNGGNALAHQGAENAVTGLQLKAKKNYAQPLVGAVKLGTFEGRAFEDLNANGVRDDGEAAISGVAVSVVPAGGQQDGVADISDADGLFSVTGVRPGDYVLEIQLPEGLIFSSAILVSGIPLDATGAYSAPVLFQTLLSRADNLIGAVRPASLQASVWLDENMNGAQDEGERQLDGLIYTLYDELRQRDVMTARAGEDGTAVFRNVRPSTYTVSFPLPANAQPVTGAGTLTEDGGLMRQTGIEIRAGDNYAGISGGLRCTTNIGGTVLADRADGRTPVAGVEVHLYMEGDPQKLRSAVTDSQGTYRFSDLWPGRYVIEVVRPDGYVFIRPNDPALSAEGSDIRQISDEYGTSDPFALYMAQDQLTHQVLLTIPAKVGSLAWLDENENGLIDGNEPMVGGVAISLDQDGTAVYSTVSNEWGYYEFDSVYPGEYVLRAVAYPQLGITVSVPALRIISSCLTLGDGSIAASDPFIVSSDSVNFFYHLGYVLKDGEKMPPEITEGASQVWTQPD